MSDLDFLLESATLLEARHDSHVRHLTSPLALRDYVRIADEMARLTRGRRVLDWGCGYGQLSYLLARRGLHVTSYDVGRAMEDDRVPVTRGLRAVRGDHEHRLPFRSAAFDAVLGCGVLEHVGDPARSLDEIRRVLVPGGQLFLYNLPQRYSYKELVLARLHLGYTHDRRYTSRSIVDLLERHGFTVVRLRRAGFLPYLATGMPHHVRRRYDAVSSRLHPLDRLLSRTPGVNRIAQSLEIVAVTSVAPLT